LLAGTAGATALGAQPKSDWEIAEDERNWRESEVALPAYPQAGTLIEFQANASATFRFFVDPASIAVVREGVVRFTLVARSPSGAESVSFEGLRCKARLHRTYAYGRSGAPWSRSSSDWRFLDMQAYQGAPFTLWSQFFCPNAIPIDDAAEGVAALRRGAHPHSAAGSLPKW